MEKAAAREMRKAQDCMLLNQMCRPVQLLVWQGDVGSCQSATFLGRNLSLRPPNGLELSRSAEAGKPPSF
jgi:hypothetical protein